MNNDNDKSILNAIGRTPIVKLGNISKGLKATIWTKLVNKNKIRS
jgi:cysteine synthase